jgi:histidine ammonia-lyase
LVILLDGETLAPAAVVRVARERAPVRLTPGAAERNATAAAALETPVAAQTVSVSRGVESHSSLAPIAARRAHKALEALRVLIATGWETSAA